MRLSDLAKAGPGLKWLSFFLVSGLLAKVLVSAAFLAPSGLWAWAGPRVSEAATPAAGSQDSPALPRLANLLTKERQALTSRESAMAAKEEQLRLLKREVEERLGELKVLQSRVMDSIEEEKRQKGEHNRHLVATLEAMPPDKAGQLLEKMAEEVAVQLLRRLKGKEAGAILAVLTPDKAARLSQRLLQ